MGSDLVFPPLDGRELRRRDQTRKGGGIQPEGTYFCSRNSSAASIWFSSHNSLTEGLTYVFVCKCVCTSLQFRISNLIIMP